VSHGPEALHAGTLEIAWVCTGRAQTSGRLSSHRFRERPPGKASLSSHEGGRVVPWGMPQGRGGYLAGNNVLRIDT